LVPAITFTRMADDEDGICGGGRHGLQVVSPGTSADSCNSFQTIAS
jgi:hypothetical protein